jgi:RNA polymerase sigma-70 factor (ECF subfamily)
MAVQIVLGETEGKVSDKAPHTEKLLIRQLVTGNEKAFRKIFDTYRNDVYAYSRSMLKTSELAEEIVQDVFLKIWLHREKINPDLSFKSYLFTIARNLTYNMLNKAVTDRKLREEVFYSSAKELNTTEAQIDEADYEIIKKKAIDQLPPKRKEIFRLSRDEGMSYEEISKELDISVSTVKGQMSKALATIREFLHQHGDLSLIITLISSRWLE